MRIRIHSRVESTGTGTESFLKERQMLDDIWEMFYSTVYQSVRYGSIFSDADPDHTFDTNLSRVQ